jgi:hypothetical protein
VAQRLVQDVAFVIKHEKGDYSVWGGLLDTEGNYRTNEIPHIAAAVKITPRELTTKYGDPSATGQFRLASGNFFEVFWYGPVCVMAKGLDSPCEAIGGWPSRLLPTQQPQARPGLPPYDWRLMEGDCEVELINPHPFGVTVGLRSSDRGMDLTVKAGQKVTAKVQPGSYQVFLVFGNEPNSLYQGDDFELKREATIVSTESTRLSLTLSATTEGNFRIRKVK